MLIKSKDSLDPALDTLQRLLESPSLTREQKESIEEEVRNIRAGARGEKQAAYHIDFRLKDAKNYASLHDLRLEHNGRVAQIDHLIVGRFFDIILVESKNIGTAIRANADGEFEVKTRFGWRGMASPIEQSKRHARVLLDLITDLNLLPKRLGFLIRPKFHHWVLVPPECNVMQKPKDAEIIKMDLFEKHMDRWIDKNSANIMKVCSRETIADFAQALVTYHHPITMDFAAKFGVSLTEPEADQPPVVSIATPEVIAPPPAIVEAQLCDSCRVPIDTKVVNFCRFNRARFDSQLLCRECQAKPKPPAPKQGSSCQQCGTQVDDKVVAFCRFNSRKFGKRVLCRTCQTTSLVNS